MPSLAACARALEGSDSGGPTTPRGRPERGGRLAGTSMPVESTSTPGPSHSPGESSAATEHAGLDANSADQVNDLARFGSPKTRASRANGRRRPDLPRALVAKDGHIG